MQNVEYYNEILIFKKIELLFLPKVARSCLFHVANEIKTE